MKAKDLLSAEELRTLADAVTAAEKKTSGELRLMIVDRSSAAPHAFILLSALISSLGLASLWVFRYSVLLHEHAGWSFAVVMLLSVGLGWVLARIPFVQRGLTFDRAEQVLARAEIEFYREGLTGTAGATGILIFLSLFERQAVVLGDRAIAEKLKPDTWRDVVDKVIEGAKSGQWLARLEEAIGMCGNILNTHFPIRAGDKNELPNHVIVKA